MGAVPYDELPNYYCHAKAIIFASSCENCPNILLESLASGRAVLSSNYDPMPEFALDAALYFNPYKHDELTSLLAQVLDDEDLRKQLGDKGAALVSTHEVEKSVNQTWKIVLNLLDK
jgi:glycosyltransferase involved in cell wall biosynthesis